ncbi:MAG: iron-only hydrogenase system regulator [Lachnospiraceae bacterium]|nr:iron-only hydrogenase system regulator [Lachnospiraceae bacterium]
MPTRVAVISIIVEDTDAVEPLNSLLHTYGPYIIGRLGIPHREKGINVICVVLDAPMDAINALSGALGRLKGISTKVAYSKV